MAMAKGSVDKMISTLMANPYFRYGFLYGHRKPMKMRMVVSKAIEFHVNPRRFVKGLPRGGHLGIKVPMRRKALYRGKVYRLYSRNACVWGHYEKED